MDAQRFLIYKSEQNRVLPVTQSASWCLESHRNGRPFQQPLPRVSSLLQPWNDKAGALSVVLTIPLPNGSGDPMVQWGSRHSFTLADED